MYFGSYYSGSYFPLGSCCTPATNTYKQMERNRIYNSSLTAKADSFEKNKKGKNNKTKNILITVGIAIASAYLAYKGHNKIKAATVAAHNAADCIGKAAGPHMAEAGRGLKATVGGIGKTIVSTLQVLASPFEAMIKRGK